MKGPFHETSDFIFHYLFALLFYVPPIINNWTTLKQMSNKSLWNQFKFSMRMNSKLKNNTSTPSDTATTTTNPKLSPILVETDAVYASGNSTHIIALNDLEKQPTTAPITAGTINVDIKTPIYVPDTNPTIVSPDSPRQMSSTDIYSDISDLNKIQSIVSYTSREQNELSQRHIELSFSKINANGRIIGKRGAPKLQKIADYQHYSSQKLPPKAMRKLTSYYGSSCAYNISVEPIGQMTKISTSRSNTNTDDITVIVMQLNHVLCTNVDKIHNKSAFSISEMTQLSKELCFGGTDRLQMIKDFLTSVCTKRNVQCFVIEDEKEKMMTPLLKAVGLFSFFETRIIGWDSKMYEDHEGKTYLILLGLLQKLNKAHNELLYIGHDKEMIEHLKSIQICERYHCKTKGLTQNDMEYIQKRYF